MEFSATTIRARCSSVLWNTSLTIGWIPMPWRTMPAMSAAASLMLLVMAPTLATPARDSASSLSLAASIRFMLRM